MGQFVDLLGEQLKTIQMSLLFLAEVSPAKGQPASSLVTRTLSSACGLAPGGGCWRI